MDILTLPGGLTVRAATEADGEQIVALNCERNGDDCRGYIPSLLADPELGPRWLTVACDGDKVVSTITLLPLTWDLEGVDLPAAQPEFVATAAGYEGRGLVRAQFDLLHRWSADRGDLFQMIDGIAYFYRQFGYEYAVDFPARSTLIKPVAAPTG